jgi:hypothetical protein
MCNLYSITTNQEAIRQLFRVVNRYVGNLNYGDSALNLALAKWQLSALPP